VSSGQIPGCHLPSHSRFPCLRHSAYVTRLGWGPCPLGQRRLCNRQPDQWPLRLLSSLLCHRRILCPWPRARWHHHMEARRWEVPCPVGCLTVNRRLWALVFCLPWELALRRPWGHGRSKGRVVFIHKVVRCSKASWEVHRSLIPAWVRRCQGSCRLLVSRVSKQLLHCDSIEASFFRKCRVPHWSQPSGLPDQVKSPVLEISCLGEARSRGLASRSLRM